MKLGVDPYTPERLLKSEIEFAQLHALPLDGLHALCALRQDIGRELPSDWSRTAGWIVAPVLTGFAQWASQHILKTQKSRCLAVMRDGKLPGQLLHSLFGVETSDIWLNRDISMRAAFGCGDDEALINWLVRTRLTPLSRAKALENLLGARCYERDQDQLLNLTNIAPTIREWEATGVLSEIRSSCKTLASNLLRHWKKVSDCESGSNEFFLIDLACAGNVQRSLNKVLSAHNESGILNGLNVATTTGAKWAKANANVMSGFLANDGEPQWFANIYGRTPELLEIFVAASSGPLIGYSNEGDPLFGVSNRLQREEEQLQEAREIVLRTSLIYQREMASQLTPNLLRCVWGRMLWAPLPEEINILGDWKMDFGLEATDKRTLAPALAGTVEEWTKMQTCWPMATLLRSKTLCRAG